MKRLNGTLRADRQPRADYAARLAIPPPPPDTLPAAAVQIWRRLAEATVGIGVLTLADLPALELLAVTLCAEQAARDTLARDGLTIEGGSGGRKHHPALAVAERARTQAMAMMDRFGLTPRARQAVTTKSPVSALPWEGGTAVEHRPAMSIDDYIAGAPPIPTVPDDAPETLTTSCLATTSA